MLLWPIQTQEFEGWPTNGFIATLAHPKSEGWKGMGPLVASTRVHECHRHPGLRSSLGWFPVHGLSSKKGNELLGPVERARELYGLATKNIESIIS